MPDSNFTVMQQERGHGAIGGIDYGPHWWTLLRRGNRMLLWVPGHRGWSGTGQPWRYVEAALILHDGVIHGDYRTLRRGGRMRDAIDEVAEKIDGYFGEGAHKLIDRNSTVVLV